MFSVHTKTLSRRCQIPPVFEKLRFRDGLVMVGPTVELNQSFQISPA